MKRNTLTTAVVAGLTGMAGMVSVSNAVNVSPDGTGQVLLYPYYSARGGNDTLVSIVNSTNRGKAVKIRFREAINSRDVLDFHIYMSPYDVWTAAVTATEDGGAQLKTSDTTCTVPYVFGDFDGETEFRDFDYNTKKADGITPTIDGGPTGIERTASGYVEVIEMGVLNATPKKDAVLKKSGGEYVDEIEDDQEDNYVAYAVKHVNGVPNDCDALVNAWTKNLDSTENLLGGYWADTAGNQALGAPSGGLFGAASIINVADGTMFSYNATAIENFMTNHAHGEPGLETPNLRTAGDVTFSNVFFDQGAALDTDDNDNIGEDGAEGGDADNNPDVVNSHWTLNPLENSEWTSTKGGDYDAGISSLLALNAALTASSISNEFTTDAGAGAKTEWVVTMPTKKFHVDTAGKGGAPLAPFSATWGKKTASCDEVTLSYWDREERSGAASGVKGPVFSPRDPGAPEEEFELCREANVIRFASDDSVPDATEILKEPKRDAPYGYNNAELSYTEGWAIVDMSARQSVAADRLSADAEDNQTQKNAYKGLPVIGFAVTSYTNGNLGDGVLANYGGTFQHSTGRTIASS